MDMMARDRRHPFIEALPVANIFCLHVNNIVYKHHNWHCTPGHGIQYVWKVSSLQHTRFFSYTSSNWTTTRILKIDFLNKTAMQGIYYYSNFSATHISTLKIGLGCKLKVITGPAPSLYIGTAVPMIRKSLPLAYCIIQTTCYVVSSPDPSHSRETFTTFPWSRGRIGT